MTIEPLVRYGKLRFTDLNRPVRTGINIAKSLTSIGGTLTTLPKPENSDNLPKGNPVVSSRKGYAKENREIVTNGRTQ
jgi:hypothetical protein